MAQRRMFSKSITNSSQFLMMPSSSQTLYFHLGMNADDDGFCEHFTIMRMTDSKPDDLRILQAKGYVSIFDDRVLVIKDWKENNYLRADRYTESKYLSIYREEMLQIGSGIPNGDTGKVRVGKESIDIETAEPRTRFKKPTVDDIKKYVSEKGFSVDAGRFFDYYESKGWVVGKSPMKSWTAAVNSWDRTERKNKTTTISTSDFMKMTPEQQAEARRVYAIQS